jgi:hypothetical protein
VRLAEAVPGAQGWRFTLENTGGATARATVSARCLHSTVTARSSGGGSSELRFGVTRRSFSTVFSPPRAEFEATACRAGGFSLAAGGHLDPASTRDVLIATPAGRRRGLWRVTGGGAGDSFTGHAVCLATESRFR